MSIGTFTILKNEASWIAAHVLRILPFVDAMHFYDGGSTDGTLEILEAIQDGAPGGGKVKVWREKDPANLQDDYTRLFNEVMHSLPTNLAWFIHPDMWVVNPEKLLEVKSSEAICLSTKMRSFGGEPGGDLFEMVGRSSVWKNIYRLRNPDLGAHYHGSYGAWNEDVYFRDITGSTHELYPEMDHYPYEIEESGLEILHFSDVRPHARRYDRMLKCLLNNGWPLTKCEEIAASHPRVTFKSGKDHINLPFTLVPAEYPAEMVAANDQYAHLQRSHAIA